MGVLVIYDKSTKKIRGAAFRVEDLEMLPSETYVEMDEDEYKKTSEIPNGNAWFLGSDNKSVYLSQWVEEEPPKSIEVQIEELGEFLSDTDYVVTKLNELRLEDDETYETEKKRYSEILKKRKEARVKIRELEDEINNVRYI